MNLETLKQLAANYPEYFDIIEQQGFALVGSEGSTYGGQCGKLQWHEISSDVTGFDVTVRDITMWGRGDIYCGQRLSALVHTQLGWRDLTLTQHPLDGWEHRWGDGITPVRPSELVQA